MKLIDIKRNSLPIDLRVKIEHVMKEENLSWTNAILFLAARVVSPSSTASSLTHHFCK